MIDLWRHVTVSQLLVPFFLWILDLNVASSSPPPHRVGVDNTRSSGTMFKCGLARDSKVKLITRAISMAPSVLGPRGAG
jgi:hypothetical protein